MRKTPQTHAERESPLCENQPDSDERDFHAGVERGRIIDHSCLHASPGITWEEGLLEELADAADFLEDMAEWDQKHAVTAAKIRKAVKEGDAATASELVVAAGLYASRPDGA
jgi:hypothetical protein